MVGHKRFGYFRLGRLPGFSKVTRRKGETLSSRYRSNGYARNILFPFEPTLFNDTKHISDILDQDPSNIGEGIEVAGGRIAQGGAGHECQVVEGGV